MNHRCIITILLTSEFRPLCARQTDIIIMKNGDRMTCKIKGLDCGVLHVDSTPSMALPLLIGRE